MSVVFGGSGNDVDIRGYRCVQLFRDRSNDLFRIQHQIFVSNHMHVVVCLRKSLITHHIVVPYTRITRGIEGPLSPFVSELRLVGNFTMISSMQSTAKVVRGLGPGFDVRQWASDYCESMNVSIRYSLQERFKPRGTAICIFRWGMFPEEMGVTLDSSRTIPVVADGPEVRGHHTAKQVRAAVERSEYGYSSALETFSHLYFRSSTCKHIAGKCREIHIIGTMPQLRNFVVLSIIQLCFEKHMV
mmetsp:Transcript_9547/g.17417  ORF Transcript_9547/g.17417 Transcript_9547/m.17417 type:complete len:244 (+) Transcript_9547:247-978(+)